jgi:hypothetical protein
MPELSFSITGVEPAAKGLTPLLRFSLALANQTARQSVYAALLHVQIQIQAPARSYSPEEKERLRELFGPPDRWQHTLRNRFWTSVTAIVNGFTDETRVSLLVPCTCDLTFAATKYFYALEDGDVPLLFLFSGTVFYESAGGKMQIEQVARDKECHYRMPLSVWKTQMERHYPNSALLNLRRDVFDRLYAFKCEQGLATWEQALEQLLASTPLEVAA